MNELEITNPWCKHHELFHVHVYDDAYDVYHLEEVRENYELDIHK